ncbi:MAG: hypothetical protein IPN07_07205 [Dehalococcoidia bacterium]|nr:hypothetical protein [Dehalococcoidia bacterium]
MREKVIMVAALAAGLAAGAGTYALFHSKSVAGGLAVITAYLVWGELGDLFRSGAVEAPRAPRAVEQPLLANPKVRRRLISLLALAGATVLILLEFVTGDLDVEDVREWIRDLGAWGPILLITVLAVAMVIAPIPEPAVRDRGGDRGVRCSGWCTR